ncbi:RDD family protein [Sinobaca sp. H24]|uniref:RDD family protein n=1 Tax=Sinobaca sp. H24 TaxID=2923376 RepID=UPI002079B98A|nr:RDD family protein [Sinobaca sp. H24]
MSGQPGGFWRRLAANIIDGFIVGIAGLIIGLIVVTIFGAETSSSPDEGWSIGVDFANNSISLLYSLALPVLWSGYTVGKKALGIRIVKKDGSNVGIGAMLMRVIVSGIVYLLTLGIGVIVSIFMVAIREDKRAIHDFIAGTQVTTSLPPAKEEAH